ncbi:secretory pathway sec39 [Stemphylium lycopersici]|nr:secretory pathway sec39 [Stemphylium lycopersici]RAR08856.1 secretory pathway sec39 [Stemphylium lycopersici]
MAALQKLSKLSGAHCVLLAVQYATQSNIAALQALTALRDGDLPLELSLSILLHYLPEECDPPAYHAYLHHLATGSRHPGESPAEWVDVASVEQLSNARAKKKRLALELPSVAHPLYAADTDIDLFTQFLIHRAHRIDAQTGLLDLVPQLVVPFLGHSEYLRTWFISTALPLLRLSYEYYPQHAAPTLDQFAALTGQRAMDMQLSGACSASKQGTHNVARDLKGIVAPWLCGANDRKRRHMATETDEWDCLFQWLLHASKDHLAMVAAAISDWDGPEDMDLGGYEEGRDYIDDHQQRHLEIQYARTALACLYAVDHTDVGSLQTAHALLGRICTLLNYDPPPDLSIAVDKLPSYNLKDPLLRDSTTALLREEELLHPENTLTQPAAGPTRVLELLIFSSCLLSTLHHPVSIRALAHMSLRDDYSEQMSLLQKILHTLNTDSKKDSEQWVSIRSKLIWLWNWGTDSHDEDRKAQGIFGMLDSKTMETEILKALLESNHFPLAIETYIKPAFGQQPLLSSDVEQVALASAMHFYDNASNGNRNRGGMKRAADILAAFAPHYPNSSRFRRFHALLSATHAMSFYSLILHHGVPFQPVNIRVSSNPLSLVRNLLSQNKGSYTKLDDLVSIGQNLVVAMPSTIMDGEDRDAQLDPAVVERNKMAAERRVIGMAIEAALEEDDFETAYSYVVNRLTPSTPPATSTSQRFVFGSGDVHDHEDEAEDVAWRAALRAGRYNSPSSSTIWSQASSTARPDLRRLEQRMDLLSQALVLAPPNHLEEVLRVWQQCEAETMHLLTQETEAEERFNDAADRKLPGTFDLETVAVQPRREVGRGAVEEAPMGLFDVARGAAAAFSKTAFPLRGSAEAASSNTNPSSSRVSMDGSEPGSIDGQERVRRRDMVTNAATGALASGIGWMLGAKPVTE